MPEWLRLPVGWVIHWDLWVEFAKAVAWPVTAVAGIMTISPILRDVVARLDRRLDQRGGRVSAGPLTIEFGERVDEVSRDVSSDPETAGEVELPASNPLGDEGDAYTTVMNGWGRVSEAIEKALQRTGAGPLNRRSPMVAVERLYRGDWITSKLLARISTLWELRNEIQSAGSNKTNNTLTQQKADEYYITAVKVARSIGNAVAYRLRPTIPTPQPTTPSTENRTLN